MSQMTWLLVDLVKVDKEIQSSSYESPDTRGTRNDHESVSEFRWSIRGSLSTGDRKVSYWAHQKVLSEIAEAKNRLYQSTGNRFLQMVIQEDVFIPLEEALAWKTPQEEGEKFSWLETPTESYWKTLVDAGFVPEFIQGSNRYQSFCGGGSEGSRKHKISIVLFWATGGAFGRGEPADVYHPTLHGVMSKDLTGEGSPSVAERRGGVVPKRGMLSVHKL